MTPIASTNNPMCDPFHHSDVHDRLFTDSDSSKNETMPPPIDTIVPPVAHTALNKAIASSDSIGEVPLLVALSLPILFLATLILTVRRISKHLRRDPFPESSGLPKCAVAPHPIFGHVSNVFSPPDSDPYEQIFTKNANEAGLSTLWFLSTPCVTVLKAEHVRSILRHSVERKSFDIFTRHFKRSLGQDSLVIMEGGQTWRHHRNLVKGAFTNNAVTGMAGKVWKVANTFSSSIARECENSDQQGSQGSWHADALDIFKWATLDVFGAVALSHDFGCTTSLKPSSLAASFDATVEDSNLRCTVRNILNPFVQFYWMPTKMNAEYKYNSENVRGLMSDICEKRMSAINQDSNNKVSTSGDKPRSRCNSMEENDDLLAYLLKSRAKPSTDEKNPHKEMVELLMTLFFAGYDTSSIALSMTMWSICQHPHVQEECAKEARAASINSATNSPDNDNSLFSEPSQWETRLAYNWAVIMETVRLHPPVFTNCRNVSKPIQLDDITLHSGTRIYLPIVHVHTDERNFARPHEFLPERWVRKEESTGKWVVRDHGSEPQVVDNDPSYIPPANPNYLFTFSDGARNCVGKRLALQESTMLLSCIVRDLVVETRPGYVLQKRKKFAMAPPTEMPLIFRKREW